GTSHFYDVLPFNNTAQAAACITVVLNPLCVNAGVFIQSVGYIDPYDPTNECTRYLGDIGPNPAEGGSGSYGFTVPAPTLFDVVVDVSNPTASNFAVCNGYSGTVSGFFDLTPGPGACAGCVPISLTPSTPNGTLGIPYSFSLQASGGSGGYQFFT